MLYCHLLELQAFFLYAAESQAWQRDACQIAWIVRFQFKQKLREFGRIATPKTSIETTTDEDIIFNDEKEKGGGGGGGGGRCRNGNVCWCWVWHFVSH